MKSSELVAALEEQISVAGALQCGEGSSHDLVEWQDRSLRLVAGIPEGSHVLEAFLALRGDGSADDLAAAQAVLREALALARALPDGEEVEEVTPGPMPPEMLPASTMSRPVETTPPSATSRRVSPALTETLQLIHYSKATSGDKERAERALTALRDEMEKIDPDWEVIRPALICLAEFGEELFFTAMTWVMQRRHGTG